MYIVYDTYEHFNALCSKYLVLELDTLEFPDGILLKAHAVIDNEHITLNEAGRIGELKDLHTNLIKNYHLKNWRYCEQAIEHLTGAFKGELDSFYGILAERIEVLKEATLAENWTGNVLVAQTENSE